MLNTFDDKNYTHYDSNKKEQAARPGLAFFDKHTQPSNDDCVSHILTDETMYGKW